MDDLILEIPNETHRQEYERVMERWEHLEDNIQPQLMRRGNTPYEKWLEYCEDDRTTGSMLSTHVPCTLYFAWNGQREIVGSIVLNHADSILRFAPIDLNRQQFSSIHGANENITIQNIGQCVVFYKDFIKKI